MLRDNPQPAVAAERFAQGLPYDLLVTNMGNLPIESRYGAFELEAVWGPWVMPRQHGSTTVGVATLNGSLCLAHTGDAAMAGLLTATKGVLAGGLRQADGASS